MYTRGCFTNKLMNKEIVYPRLGWLQMRAPLTPSLPSPHAVVASQHAIVAILYANVASSHRDVVPSFTPPYIIKVVLIFCLVLFICLFSILFEKVE